MYLRQNLNYPTIRLEIAKSLRQTDKYFFLIFAYLSYQIRNNNDHDFSVNNKKRNIFLLFICWGL